MSGFLASGSDFSYSTEMICWPGLRCFPQIIEFTHHVRMGIHCLLLEEVVKFYQSFRILVVNVTSFRAGCTND
jgi:hypothetical protein